MPDVEESGNTPKTKSTKPVKNKIIQKSIHFLRNLILNKIVLFFLFCSLVWLVIYLVVGESALLGGGIYFSIIIMFITAHVFGFIFEAIKMPALLGMLIVGIGFRNIPYVNVIGLSIDPYTSSILRYIPLLDTYPFFNSNSHLNQEL